MKWRAQLQAAIQAINPDTFCFYRSPSSSSSNLNIGGVGPDRGDRNDSMKVNLGKTSLWKGFNDIIDETQRIAIAHNDMAQCLMQDIIEPFVYYVKDMELVRKSQVEKGADYIKNLQDAYVGLKKVKRDHDGFLALSTEASSIHLRAQQNPGTKDRELEKLTQKMQVAIEKAKRSEDALQLSEEFCRNAHEDYYGLHLPGLYEEIRVREEERCLAAKRVMSDYLYLEKLHCQSFASLLDALAERIGAIDIAEDSEEFVATHQNYDDKRMIRDIPAQSIHNKVHAGRVLVKKGDIVTGWKPKYFVLGQDRKLFVYDKEDSTTPRDIVDLKDATVYSLDQSYFGKENCFQFMFDTSAGRLVYNVTSEIGSESERWFNLLRERTLCCTKCGSTYGFSMETGLNKALADGEGGYIVARNLELGIVEAKDLPSGSRGLSPYCGVYLDDIKQARTSTKAGESPFWGENFSLFDFRPHHTRVRIVVYHHNRIQRDVDIGYIAIPLDTLKLNKRSEEWYQIRHIPVKGVEEPSSHLGSIRVSMTYSVLEILPMESYSDFLNALTDSSFMALKQISRVVVAQRESLAKSSLAVLRACNVDLEAVKSLIEADIMATEDPNIIFRGNSLATKMMDQFMKLVGMDFLHDTIADHVRKIIKNGESCELDPTRLDPSDNLKTNFERLISHVVVMWEKILYSMEQCPPELINIFIHIRSVVMTRWPDESPKLFCIVDDFPDAMSNRTLTLIAKIIQNLANLTEFGYKEPFMKECNPFIQNQIPRMKALIDRISMGHVTITKAEVRLRPKVLRRDLESLYQLFLQHSNELRALPEDPKLAHLLKILSDLETFHSAFRMRHGGGEDASLRPPGGIQQRGASLTNLRVDLSGKVAKPVDSRAGSATHGNYPAATGAVSPGSTFSQIPSASPQISPPQAIPSMPPKIELNLHNMVGGSDISLDMPSSLMNSSTTASVSNDQQQERGGLHATDSSESAGVAAKVENESNLLTTPATAGYRRHREISIYGRDALGNIEHMLQKLEAQIAEDSEGGSNESVSKESSQVDFLRVDRVPGGEWVSQGESSGGLGTPASRSNASLNTSNNGSGFPSPSNSQQYIADSESSLNLRESAPSLPPPRSPGLGPTRLPPPVPIRTAQSDTNMSAENEGSLAGTSLDSGVRKIRSGALLSPRSTSTSTGWSPITANSHDEDNKSISSSLNSPGGAFPVGQANGTGQSAGSSSLGAGSGFRLRMGSRNVNTAGHGASNVRGGAGVVTGTGVESTSVKQPNLFRSLVGMVGGSGGGGSNSTSPHGSVSSLASENGSDKEAEFGRVSQTGIAFPSRSNTGNMSASSSSSSIGSLQSPGSVTMMSSSSALTTAFLAAGAHTPTEEEGYVWDDAASTRSTESSRSDSSSRVHHGLAGESVGPGGASRSSGNRRMSMAGRVKNRFSLLLHGGANGHGFDENPGTGAGGSGANGSGTSAARGS
ncbi:Ras GTPase-activating protein 1, partial [Blyttiomyces sp. JEL0837]